MSQELIQREPQTFGGRTTNMTAHINAGAVSIEQERAIAEARGSIQIAQMFPRDMAAARAELMIECDYPEFASVAFYSVPRAGGAVTGPSIRLAESVASAYGHMEWGHRELSRSEDKSEVEVFAWDKQKNNKRTRQVTVDHYRDTKNGRIRLRDEKDIQDKIANVSAKQMRGCILALLPKSLTEAAMARCRNTLANGGGIPLVERVHKMIDAFSKLGVGSDLIKEYLGHPIGETNGDEIVDLTAIYQAIKGGDKIADYFGKKDDEQSADDLAVSLEASAKLGAQTQQRAASPRKSTPKKAEAAEATTTNQEPDPKPEAKPDPEPEQEQEQAPEQAPAKVSNPEKQKSTQQAASSTTETAADENLSEDEADIF